MNPQTVNEQIERALGLIINTTIAVNNYDYLEKKWITLRDEIYRILDLARKERMRFPENPELNLADLSASLAKVTTCREEFEKVGMKAFGTIGVISAAEAYDCPPYLAGKSYKDLIGAPLYIANAPLAFAYYQGYMYLACHVDYTSKDYLYVPIYAIDWDFSNAIAMMLFEMCYYGDIRNFRHLTWYTSTPTRKNLPVCNLVNKDHYLPVELTFYCLVAGILGIEGTNSNHQTIWGRFSISGLRVGPKTISFDSFTSKMSLILQKYRHNMNTFQELRLGLADYDGDERLRLIEILNKSEENYHACLKELHVIQETMLKIAFKYYDGTDLSIIKVLHEITVYFNSNFGETGKSRLVNSNINLIDNLYQFNADEITDEFHDFITAELEGDHRIVRNLIYSISDFREVSFALHNLWSELTSATDLMVKSGPSLIAVLDSSLRTIDSGDTTLTMFANKFKNIPLLPHIHAMRYKDNPPTPVPTLVYSRLTSAMPFSPIVGFNLPGYDIFCGRQQVYNDVLPQPELDAFTDWKLKNVTVPLKNHPKDPGIRMADANTNPKIDLNLT